MGVTSRTILSLSAVLLLIGFVIELVLGWESAPAPIALMADVYGIVFVTARNGLFEGLFYVAVGMNVGIGWGRRLEWNLAPTIACMVLGLMGSVLVSSSAHLPFCAMFAIALFLLCVRRTGEPSYVWARKASTVIYLVHMVFVVLFVYGICGYSGIDFLSAPLPHVALYAFTMICSLAIATAVIIAGSRFPAIRAIFGV